MKFSEVGCKVLQKKTISVGFGCFKAGIVFGTPVLLHACVDAHLGFFFWASYLKKTESIWKIARSTQKSRNRERIKFYCIYFWERKQIMKTWRAFSRTPKVFAPNKSGRFFLVSAGGRGNPCSAERENNVALENHSALIKYASTNVWKQRLPRRVRGGMCPPALASVFLRVPSSEMLFFIGFSISS